MLYKPTLWKTAKIKYYKL